MVDPFHQILRDFFDEKVAKGGTLTPQQFVTQLNRLLPTLLCAGKFTSNTIEFGVEGDGASELSELLGFKGETPWMADEFEDAADGQRQEIRAALEQAVEGI